MAGKGRRAAARQGELSRRRKKNQRGPSGIPSVAPNAPRAPVGGMPALAVEGAAAVGGAATAVSEPQEAPPATQPEVRPVPQARSQGRQRGERPAAYSYVGSEVRRIAALASVAVAALVVLSFVL